MTVCWLVTSSQYCLTFVCAGKSEVLRGLRSFLCKDSPEHHSTGHWKTVEKGSGQSSTLRLERNLSSSRPTLVLSQDSNLELTERWSRWTRAGQHSMDHLKHRAVKKGSGLCTILQQRQQSVLTRPALELCLGKCQETRQSTYGTFWAPQCHLEQKLPRKPL